MRLKKYLNEFNKAPDNDWYTKGKTVIVFHKNEKYIKVGKTHGAQSHAIKHTNEIEPDKFNKIIDQIKSYLKDKRVYYKNRKNEIVDGELTTNTIINTLDMVNDKIMNKQELTPEGKWLKKKIDEIAEIYRNRLNKFKENSIDITDKTEQEIEQIVKNDKVLKIPCENKFIVFVNFNSLLFAVNKKGKGPVSFYKIDNLSRMREKIKSNKPLNKIIVKI